MKKNLIFLLSISLIMCKQVDKKPNNVWKTIEIGDYIIDFPNDFELVAEKGIDSYVGKIKADSMQFEFDYGYYSNENGQTPQEYLDEGLWRFDLPNRFMKAGVTYDNTNMPKVDILSIRPAKIQDSIVGKGCDYVAKCKYEKTEFDFAIYIPDEIEQINCDIDTFDNHYRKIVWAKDPQKGTTGIYIKRLDALNQSMNAYVALSISADKLTSEQQKLALKIFKTVRRKKGG